MRIESSVSMDFPVNLPEGSHVYFPTFKTNTINISARGKTPEDAARIFAEAKAAIAKAMA